MPRDDTAQLRTMVTALREVILAGESYRRAAASRLGVTGTESQVISYLVTRGPMQPNELADAIGVSSGSITAILDSLHTRDLIDRRPHPTDRRRSVIHPSEFGAAMIISAAGWLDDVCREVASAEQVEATRLLQVLAAGLRERAVSVMDEPLPAPQHAY